MGTTTKTVLGFFLAAAVAAAVNGNVVIVTHNTTISLTCTTSSRRTPDWFVNETVVATRGDRYRVSASNGVAQTATLTINGNLTCETVNVYCEVFNTTEGRFVRMHNTILRFQGRLPSPKNVHIKEHFNSSINNSSTIEWSPPYSAMNNESGIIHVNPHITQYTVYITDNYTGNFVIENVTETQFTFINQGDSLCPMYQVSAWNAGGEGELSAPVQGSIPRVPHNGSITVRSTVTTNVVHIHINNVDVVCTSRIPEFFLITLMTSTGSVLNETRQHRPGPVANFTISLPQTVDMCTLHVRISAGNSAGMSAPSEAVEVVCSGDSTDSTTTTASTTAVTTITTSGSGSEGNNQQGNSTTLIVVVIGIFAAIVGVVIVAATVGIIYCRAHKKHKVKKNSEIEMKPNQAYETVTLPSPPQSAVHVHTKPCPAYEVVVQACH